MVEVQVDEREVTDAEMFDALLQIPWFTSHHPRIGVKGTHAASPAIYVASYVFDALDPSDRRLFVDWARALRANRNATP